MNISSYIHGRKIFWVKDAEAWFYFDNGESADIERPCKRCGRLPTPEGYDACLGYIKGAESACCGHGVTEPFIRMSIGGKDGYS